MDPLTSKDADDSEHGAPQLGVPAVGAGPGGTALGAPALGGPALGGPALPAVAAGLGAVGLGAVGLGAGALGGGAGPAGIGFQRAAGISPERVRTVRLGGEGATVTLPSVEQMQALSTFALGVPRGERFTDEGQLAQGGMGIVHKVHDKLLCRKVALKIMQRTPAEHGERAQRFVEEAQITGQLDHPHIVPVHDLGIDMPDGRVYFTMKLVHGSTLTELMQELHEEPLSGRALERILGVFLKICDAVSFAHSRGVIHRDLKPDNIMVGSHGQVYLMDWGVALVVADRDRYMLDPSAANVPQSGVVGTPAYMAPEQAWGQMERIDARTDVYGLGGILYELLTGRGPHFAEDSVLALKMAREAEVIDPNLFAIWPDLPPGLCEITMKALAREPEKRYQTAYDLADDVQQFLMGGGWFKSERFEPGVLIIAEGDLGERAFIIEQGTCEVFKMINGERVPLRTMGPGDVFGETAVLSEGARTASVQALDTVVVKVVTRDTLNVELERNPWLHAFVKALADRFCDVDAQLTQLRAERQGELPRSEPSARQR